MCGSISNDYNEARDGRRTQENAILYALKQTRAGRDLYSLVGSVDAITGRYAPIASLRRAIGGLRRRGYRINVDGGRYTLVTTR